MEGVELLRLVLRRAPETAIRLRNILEDIWDFAILKQYVTVNVMSQFEGKDIGKAIKKHYAAIVDPKDFGFLIKSIKELTCNLVTKNALLIDAHTFIRSSELRYATWGEIDFEGANWYIPAQRMKLKRDHVIPLSRQVIELLKELKIMASGNLVFPSPTNATKPISDNLLGITIKRMGFDGSNFPEHTLHGFRAAFRTMGDERLRFPMDIIEHQLAHSVADPLGTAYNRTAKLEDRLVMMQSWSDYIDKLSSEAG
jgi:integrase